MCTVNGLIGPPEIRTLPPDPPPPEILPLPTDPPPAAGEPFLDSIDAGFNSIAVKKDDDDDDDDDDDAPLLMGRTENNSATYLSTGNPCLDFFFKVVPGTSSSEISSLLAAAWRHDALAALKLVCNLRGVRGTGKSDKEGFYSAALWIHANHPKTLALNLGIFAEFGYMKDLPEILYRLINGADSRADAKQERKDLRRERRRKFSAVSKQDMAVIRQDRVRDRRRKFKANIVVVDESKKKRDLPREERIAAELEKVKLEVVNASKERKKKKVRLAGLALDRYNGDPDYRFLHDRTSELFAGLLASDMEQLRAGKLNKIGLAAKWCPSLDTSFDRATLLCESIARRVFPAEAFPEYAGVGEEHYAYRVRDRLRREVLVPLRKVLELPELYMSSRRWDELPYNRVASVAMKNYKKIFQDHDKDRFEEFLEKVKEGKAKIAAGAILPHEILAPAIRGEKDQVAELQWQRMVDDMKQKGKLNNCIAVCDVSGSMEGTPMDVCVALGLLTSELCEEPWKGRVITFSANPELHMINGETLLEKVKFIKNMDWGGNTDFQKVFDKLLEVAVGGNLPPEKMVKRVFVFSDMEFDQASANTWETDYEVIRRKFGEAGYADAVPEIVFWNLRASRSIPTSANQKGVALVAGYSKNSMKLFLEGGGIVDPVTVMEMAIAGSEYKKLVVFD